VRRLGRIAKSGPRRTSTSCDFVAANRRQNCGAVFSCGKTRFFRGYDVAARRFTRSTRLPWFCGKVFHEFATRRWLESVRRVAPGSKMVARRKGAFARATILSGQSISGSKPIMCCCGGRGAFVAKRSSVATKGLLIVLRKRVRPLRWPPHFEQERPTTGVNACSPALNSVSPQRSHFNGTIRPSRCGNEF
jgi:hypothetical protein